MANKKTSPKRGFSFEAMPSTKIRKGTPLSAHKASSRLSDPKLVRRALAEAIMDGDADAFKEILSAHLEIVNKESFYKAAGLSRRTLFRMLGPDGNPTLSNIARVVTAIAAKAA